MGLFKRRHRNRPDTESILPRRLRGVATPQAIRLKDTIDSDDKRVGTLKCISAGSGSRSSNNKKSALLFSNKKSQQQKQFAHPELSLSRSDESSGQVDVGKYTPPSSRQLLLAKDDRGIAGRGSCRKFILDTSGGGKSGNNKNVGGSGRPVIMQQNGVVGGGRDGGDNGNGKNSNKRLSIMKINKPTAVVTQKSQFQRLSNFGSFDDEPEYEPPPPGSNLFRQQQQEKESSSGSPPSPNNNNNNNKMRQEATSLVEQCIQLEQDAKNGNNRKKQPSSEKKYDRHRGPAKVRRSRSSKVLQQQRSPSDLFFLQGSSRGGDSSSTPTTSSSSEEQQHFWGGGGGGGGAFRERHCGDRQYQNFDDSAETPDTATETSPHTGGGREDGSSIFESNDDDGNEFNQFVFDKDFRKIEKVVVEKSDSGAGSENDIFRMAAVETVKQYSIKSLSAKKDKMKKKGGDTESAIAGSPNFVDEFIRKSHQIDEDDDDEEEDRHRRRHQKKKAEPKCSANSSFTLQDIISSNPFEPTKNKGDKDAPSIENSLSFTMQDIIKANPFVEKKKAEAPGCVKPSFSSLSDESSPSHAPLVDKEQMVKKEKEDADDFGFISVKSFDIPDPNAAADSKPKQSSTSSHHRSDFGGIKSEQRPEDCASSGAYPKATSSQKKASTKSPQPKSSAQRKPGSGHGGCKSSGSTTTPLGTFRDFGNTRDNTDFKQKLQKKLRSSEKASSRHVPPNAIETSSDFSKYPPPKTITTSTDFSVASTMSNAGGTAAFSLPDKKLSKKEETSGLKGGFPDVTDNGHEDDPFKVGEGEETVDDSAWDIDQVPFQQPYDDTLINSIRKASSKDSNKSSSKDPETTIRPDPSPRGTIPRSSGGELSKDTFEKTRRTESSSTMKTRRKERNAPDEMGFPILRSSSSICSQSKKGATKSPLRTKENSSVKDSVASRPKPPPPPPPPLVQQKSSKAPSVKENSSVKDSVAASRPKPPVAQQKSSKAPTGVPENAILASMLFRQTEVVGGDDNLDESSVTSKHKNSKKAPTRNKDDVDHHDEDNSTSRFEVPPAIHTRPGRADSVVSSVTEEASTFYLKNLQNWKNQANSALNNYHKFKKNHPGTYRASTAATDAGAGGSSRSSAVSQRSQRPTWMDRVEEEHMKMFSE